MYKTFIYYSETEELEEVEENNTYVLECDIDSDRSNLSDGTVTYCYITDVTKSYVDFICNFETEMKNMITEDDKIKLSVQFNDIVKENINKYGRCINKDMELLNRLFSEHVDRDVRLDILRKMDERNKEIYF